MGKYKLKEEDISTLDKQQRGEVKRLQKLLNSAISKGNHLEESKLCNTLGEILAEAGLLQLGLRYHMQDLEISEKHGKPLDIAVAHRKVGEVYSELGEFDPAISHQSEYLQIAETQSDLIEQQRAHATLGRTYYTQLMSESGDHIDALRKKSSKHYSNALKLTASLREKKLLTDREICEMRARLDLNIGLLYDKVNAGLSTQYLERALTEAQGIHDTATQHLALLHLSETNLRDGDLTQALMYAEQAVKTSKSCDNQGHVAESKDLCALIHLHSNNIPQARSNAKQALMINSDLTDAMLVYKCTKLAMSTQHVDFGEGPKEAETLAKVTQILIKLNLFTHALHWLEKELNMVKRCDIPPQDTAEVHKKLAICYEDRSDVKLALYHYTQVLSRAPSSTTWCSVALLSIDKNYETCFDAVQAGIGEATTPAHQAHCLHTLVQIAHHFEKDEVVATATKELESLDLADSESTLSQTQDDDISDVEISESESELEDSESETRPVRKNNKLSKVNEKGETPLHQAAVAGNTDKVHELLRKHLTPNTRDNAGWTPLHEACNYGYIEVVEMLVSAGADVNDRGGVQCGGITPLHDAAQWGHANIVRYLIENGANVLAKDDEGRTALSCVQQILQDGPENSEIQVEIRDLLVAAAKNPRKIKPSKRVDPTDLFNDEAACVSYPSTSRTLPVFDNHPQTLPKIIPDYPPRSRRQANQRSKQLGRSRSMGSKLVSEVKTTKSSEQQPNNWLEEDCSSNSPKRKQPQDPFLPKANEKKRLKQTKILPHVIGDESSPGLPQGIDSKPIKPTPTTSISDKVLRVKVRVRDLLFLIPVQYNQTIEDISNVASQRYQSAIGLLPKLNLTTRDGALLNRDDLAPLLLQDGDELIGVIRESQQEPLLDKYLNVCQRMSLEPIFENGISNSSTVITISKAVCSAKHLECLFTTALCFVSLTSLDLSYNRIGAEVVSTFTNTLTTLKSLHHLNINGCGINKSSFLKISTALEELPLESLSCDFNNISGCYISLLELVVGMSLTSLSAKNCSLSHDSIIPTELSVKFANSKLKTLDLSQNSVTRYPEFPETLTTLTLGGCEMFKDKITLPLGLETVKLEKCGLSNGDLGQLAGLRHVVSLSVPFNNVTSEGVVELLMMFPALQHLYLSSNPLGVSGIEELSLVAPPNLAIAARNCGGSDMSHDLISTLTVSLAHIDLSYNNINYPALSKHLSDETRAAVTCLGGRLVIKSGA